MNVHDIRVKQDAELVSRIRSAGSGITPPPSLDSVAMATKAVRNVRRRRTVLVVVGGVAGAVLAASGGLALAYDPASEGAVLPGAGEASEAPSPSPVVSVEPTPEETGPQPAKLPKGWQAAEFSGLSYAMPGSWREAQLEEDTMDWTGPGQEFEAEGDETLAGSIADTMFMRIDAQEPPTWEREGKLHREEDLDVPGAESATLAAGADPASGQDWADLLIHHQDGLWYSVHLDFVTDAARPEQVVRGFAESLAFTSSAEEVRATIEGLQGSDDLPVIEVDHDTPSDWVPQELDGMRYAVPAGMSPDPMWDGEDSGVAEGWLVTDGVQDGIDLDITVISEYSGYGATMAPPEDAQSFQVAGAGRVEVTLRESEPWHNGATPLALQFRIWDEEMAGVWDISATLPNTEEGRQTALRILGSVRLG
jgi:hypothetical protein